VKYHKHAKQRFFAVVVILFCTLAEIKKNGDRGLAGFNFFYYLDLIYIQLDTTAIVRHFNTCVKQWNYNNRWCFITERSVQSQLDNIPNWHM